MVLSETYHQNGPQLLQYRVNFLAQHPLEFNLLRGAGMGGSVDMFVFLHICCGPAIVRLLVYVVVCFAIAFPS